MSGESRQDALDQLVGGMVWPLFKRFMASEYTVATLAKKIGHSRAEVEQALIADPGVSLIGIYGSIAWALGTRISFELRPPGDPA